MAIWQPDFGKEPHRYGELHKAWEGSSPYSIIYLMDPPKNILSARQYQIAQHSIAKIYARIPGYEPFVVGVQRDFWPETTSRTQGSPPPKLSKAYLDQGGQGLAFALTQKGTLPPVVCLEDEQTFKEYQTAEAATLKFMELARPFVSSLSVAFKDARTRYYSPPLAEFTSLVRKFRDIEESIKVAQYGKEIWKIAQSLGLTFPAALYRTLIVGTEVEVEGARAKEEEEELAQAIYTASHPQRLTPRATWEIYRYALTRDYESKIDKSESEVQAELEQITHYLEQQTLREPSPETRTYVSKLARSLTHRKLRRIMPGHRKDKLVDEPGDLLSTSLEMAALLGIDLTEFPILARYIQYRGMLRKMADSYDDYVTALNHALRKLERSIPQKLAQTDIEKILVSLEPHISFLEELVRYQFTHEADTLRIIDNLYIVDLCENMARVKVSMPAEWKRKAHTLDGQFEVVRDFFYAMLSRGTDLASTLVAAMVEHEVTKGVLYCDGYFHTYIAPWLKGKYISYAFMRPSWSESALESENASEF